MSVEEFLFSSKMQNNEILLPMYCYLNRFVCTNHCECIQKLIIQNILRVIFSLLSENRKIILDNNSADAVSEGHFPVRKMNVASNVQLLC